MTEFAQSEHALPIVDYVALKERLQLQLEHYKHPVIDALVSVLDDPPTPVHDIEYVACAFETFQTYVTQKEPDVKFGVRIATLEAYPDEFIQNEELPSHRRYAKNNGLAGGERSQLRQARELAITNSKDKLRAQIAYDNDYHASLNNIGNTELLNDIESVKQGIARKVEKLVVQVERALPVERNRALAAKILKWMHIDYPALEIRRKKSKLQLLGELTDELVHAADIERITKAVLDINVKKLDDTLDEQILNRYAATMAENAAESLPQKIKEAYSLTTQNVTYVPQPKDHTPVPLELKNKTTEAPKKIYINSAVGHEPVVERIGKVESPFPWLRENQIVLSALRNSHKVLLFCKAILPKTLKLSNKLGGDERFKPILTRTLRMELNGQNGVHSTKIKRLVDCEFFELPIFIILAGAGNVFTIQ